MEPITTPIKPPTSDPVPVTSVVELASVTDSFSTAPIKPPTSCLPVTLPPPDETPVIAASLYPAKEPTASRPVIDGSLKTIFLITPLVAPKRPTKSPVEFINKC